jgi:hypothetical protein
VCLGVGWISNSKHTSKLKIFDQNTSLEIEIDKCLQFILKRKNSLVFGSSKQI